jgi:small subunit ribosomal protein S1
VDLERERVSLSLKKAQEDPWETLAKDKPAGSTIHGKVTKLVPFGAFVEIGSGVEGLVHISELAWEHIEFPEEVVSVGEEVDAKIIDIDLERRRISLSLKQLTGPGEGEYHEYGEESGKEPELVEAQEFEEKASESEAGEPAQPVARDEIVSEAADIAAEVEEVATATLESSPAAAGAVEPPAAPQEQTQQAAEPQRVEEPPQTQEPAQADAQPAELNAVAETEPEAAAPEERETAEPEEPEAEPDAATEPADNGSLESILADMKKKGQHE